MTSLLVFPHSHFCEKARWALDYKGIDFSSQAIMPGLHLKTIRKIAPRSSVPVLINDDGSAIQGSSAIIDFLDQHHPQKQLTPHGAENRQACVDIEAAMDEQLGVNLRQILYSTLLDHPAFIRQCFTHTMPWYKKPFYRAIAPTLHKQIYKSYVISAAKVAVAKTEFAVAMDALAEQLKDKRYLLGDSFSRADLSVAAMLSLLTQPLEHPFPWGDNPDPAAKAFCDLYRDHPVTEWVNGLYREYRQNPS
jgi:glutathione S-transferase